MRLLLGLLLVVGCKGKSEDKPADKPVEKPAPAPGPGSAKPVDEAVKNVPGKMTLQSEEPKVRAGYRAGMRKGRKATDAKKWDEAIAGFDQALAAKQGDARAYGERGFARLLEGKDLDAAARDLDRAASTTKDAKLLSSIWFNRGLIEEKRGNQLNASADFVIANTLRPTEAAKAKLAGKSACPVTVGYGIDLMDHKPIDGADWIALAKATGLEGVDALTTKDAALELLTGERTEPKLPALFTPSDFTWKVPYYVVRTAKGLHAIPIAEAQGGRCPGTAEYEVVTEDAKHVLISGQVQWDGGYTFMCRKAGDEDGETFECTDKDGEESAGTACFGGTPEHDDIVLDRATGNVVLVLSQPEEKGLATVALTADGLKLAGRSCDRVEPFGK